MMSMLDNTALSIANYDALLSGWSALGSLQSGVQLGAVSLEYCAGASARQNLIDDYSWTIDDAGKESPGLFCPYVFADKAELQDGVALWIYDEESATSTYGDIPTWDVSLVTDMSELFQGATSFNSDVSDWNVSGVTDMNYMFSDAAAFNGDIGAWDVSNVTNMDAMFNDAALSSANYDALLSGWSALGSLQSGVALGALGVKYCNVSARDLLTNAPNNWILTDDGESDNCAPPLTIDDFLILQSSGTKLYKTELLQEAIRALNESTGNTPPATLMDFVKGEVVNGQVFMEFDLQAIVDAINGDNPQGGDTVEEYGDDTNNEDDAGSEIPL
jgi:surface protein